MTANPHRGLVLRSDLEYQLPPNLPAQVQKAATLVLAEQPTALAYTSVDLRKALYQPMSAVAMLLGHSNSLADGKDLKVMGTALAAVIHRRFAALKLPEITEALIRGASGEWPLPGNGFLAPTLPNFTHWLVCYQNQCRSRAIEVLRLAQEQAEQQLLGPATLDESGFPQLVAEMAEEFAQTGTFSEKLDPGNLAYEWLKRIGAFNGFKTAEQYRVMMRKESIKLSQARAEDIGQRHKINSFGEQIRRGWPAEHPLANSVVNNCKKRLLREWLRYQVVNKNDLVKMLTRQAKWAAKHHQIAAE